MPDLSTRSQFKNGPHEYTELQKGDHVRMVVRDPRDRLISAYKWFTDSASTGIIVSAVMDIVEQSVDDHRILMGEGNPTFVKWLNTVLQYWNPHWAPQSEIHPRWREYELISIEDLHELGFVHEKKIRKNRSWEQHYDEATLALVNEVYKEDLEIWEVVKDGTDTGTNRIL